MLLRVQEVPPSLFAPEVSARLLACIKVAVTDRTVRLACVQLLLDECKSIGVGAVDPANLLRVIASEFLQITREILLEFLDRITVLVREVQNGDPVSCHQRRRFIAQSLNLGLVGRIQIFDGLRQVHDTRRKHVVRLVQVVKAGSEADHSVLQLSDLPVGGVEELRGIREFVREHDAALQSAGQNRHARGFCQRDGHQAAPEGTADKQQTGTQSITQRAARQSWQESRVAP